MREALETAEKLARLEKIRASRKHISQFNPEDERRACVSINSDQETPKSWYESQTISETGGDSAQTTCRVPDSSRSVAESHTGSVVVTTIKQPPPRMGAGAEGVLIAAEGLAMPADGLAVVLGTAGVDGGGGGGQLALLMSPSTLLENRLLTPSKYRLQARERATQTDTEAMGSARASRSKAKKNASNPRKDRKKSASLDRPHRGCKLPLRCRSQSQPGQARLNLEDRPKWGVNRPGTQYMKQSEKDPYYQRRLRQRLLRAAMLAEGGGGAGDTGTESDCCPRRRQRTRRGSSEDNSRSPSPPVTNSRSLFYRHPPRLSERSGDKHDVSIISLDLSTLDSFDHEQFSSDNKRDMMMKASSYQSGTPSKRVQVVVPSQNVSHRLMDSTPQRKALGQSNMPRHLSLKGGGSQRLLNRKTQAPATLDTKPSHNLEKWSSHDILSQLSSLREGLLLKQQEWETQRSQTPFSESSWQS